MIDLNMCILYVTMLDIWNIMEPLFSGAIPTLWDSTCRIQNTMHMVDGVHQTMLIYVACGSRTSIFEFQEGQNNRKNNSGNAI